MMLSLLICSRVKCNYYLLVLVLSKILQFYEAFHRFFCKINTAFYFGTVSIINWALLLLINQAG